MDLLEGISLRRHILESYSRNPKGWSFVISPSLKSGFFDALVSGPDGAWMLKIDSLFKPFPVVLGSPTEAVPGFKPASPFPYGYRRLSRDLALQMLGGYGGQPGGKKANILSVLRLETVAPEEGRRYAEGPFVLASPSEGGLSESRRELGEKLTNEMRRLLRARYPAYG